MTSFLELPEDVLTEVLGNLPAMSILACRKVCQKLNRLSKSRHVWMSAFYQSQHMLPPTMDPTKELLPRIESVLTRAEKLYQLWSNEEAMSKIHPRTYHSRIPESSKCFPLGVMGDFVIYADPPGRTDYLWISKQDMTGECVSFKYKFPDDFEETLYYMDHATGTFHMIFLSRTAELRLRIVEVKLDVMDGQPRVENSSHIMLPKDRKLEATRLYNHFVCFRVHSNLPGQCFLDILDLRTRVISQVSMMYPGSAVFPEPQFRGRIMISESDAYILLSIAEKFLIYRYPDPEDEPLPPLARCSRTQLPIAFSGVHPAVLHSDGFFTSLPSPAIVGFDHGYGIPSKLHFLHLGNSEAEGLGESECIDFTATIDGWSFTIPSSRFSYGLGMASTASDELAELNGGMVNITTCFYAVLLDGIGRDQDLSGRNRLTTVWMDLSPWLADPEGSTTRVIDFDPFSGTVLLCSLPKPQFDWFHKAMIFPGSPLITTVINLLRID